MQVENTDMAELHFVKDIKGPYADHILNPQGSTASSIFFDIK